MRMIDVESDDRIQDIQRKLDWITEELAASKRHRLEMKELKDDITVVAKDVFQTAVYELEDVSPFVKTGDFVHLLKKLIRNIRPITETLSQLENARDFLNDLKPLNKEIFCDVLHKLDDLDRKGYFKLIRELGKAVDNSVRQLTDEEIAQIADNITSLIDLLKLASRMNIPQIAKKALSTMGDLNVTEYEARSSWDIVKEFNSPEIRRLLGLVMMFMTSFTDEINKNYKEGVTNAN
jgi:uncharacterized protein YjgD (DUF1641 family)